MSRLSDLEEALRILKTGPSSLEPTHPFGTLTKAQRTEVSQNLRLWSSTWIEPAIEAEIAALKAAQKTKVRA